MIWVFKTSVNSKRQVAALGPLLDRLVLPDARWNFDLNDCDCILRIDGVGLNTASLIRTLNDAGFHCEELCD